MNTALKIVVGLIIIGLVVFGIYFAFEAVEHGFHNAINSIEKIPQDIAHEIKQSAQKIWHGITHGNFGDALIGLVAMGGAITGATKFGKWAKDKFKGKGKNKNKEDDPDKPDNDDPKDPDNPNDNISAQSDPDVSVTGPDGPDGPDGPGPGPPKVEGPKDPEVDID